MLPEVRRTEIDGVPVFWTDTPGRLHAELVFGVGSADESFLTTGITHLVEHLVMRVLGEYDHAANACVGLSTTTFEVSSSPAVVVDHLERVCRAIGGIDVGPLDVERKVLAAEEDHHGPPVLAWWPLSVRFGNRGPGLAGNVELGPHHVSAEDVLGWGGRWLHRGNAALVLDGPPPDGLRLPLPDGPPVTRPVPVPLPLPTPAWTPGLPGTVLAAMYGPWSAELAAGLGIMGRRLTATLRHDSGLLYHLGLNSVPLAGGSAIGVGADVQDRDVWAVATALLDALDDLCATGPTAAELERDRAMLREALGDPDMARDAPFAAAAEHLLGFGSDSAHHARVLAGLDGPDVAAALRAARASMVLSVPDGHRIHRLPELPFSRTPPVTGRVHARRTFGSGMPRGSTMTVGTEGITVRLGREGEVATVLFADVVAVVVDDDALRVAAGSGLQITVSRNDWKGGDDIAAAVRAAVAPELFLPAPPDWLTQVGC